MAEHLLLCFNKANPAGVLTKRRMNMRDALQTLSSRIAQMAKRNLGMHPGFQYIMDAGERLLSLLLSMGKVLHLHLLQYNPLAFGDMPWYTQTTHCVHGRAVHPNGSCPCIAAAEKENMG